jgi:isopentenyl diphosphate isomerase/L-lactate dehydrogenase-like FMN-dependent dehydrogenase
MFDAKKCAEIGAAAVGRSMLPHLESKGVEGVRELLENVGNELRYIMSSTGFKNPAEIDDSVLWMNPV